ncbi:MAG: succinyl-diaminopimelate desuccinylase [Sphingomonadaceae bacterium]
MTVLALAQALITAPSVTPATGAVFDVLEAALTAIGFEVDRFICGDAPDGPVENLFATRGGDGPHFAFAGHLDVVPPGSGWSSDPFTPQVRGDLLYGRGAVDMKGSIAAFVAAIPAQHEGRISLIITGDEEGPAVFGTVALIDHIRARGLIPDLCLVGEPTSVAQLGDMVKIGRRGSVNIWITMSGVQGHVAYPHLADNPIPKLVRVLSAIEAITLDDGTEWFQRSNIEITDLDVRNPATNVIPAAARARISIRFNDLHSGASLVERIGAIVSKEGGEIIAKISGEAFITMPGAFSSLVSEAISSVTGITPELSTTGGTSDARFLSQICPVVEFGLTNATMHKLDEAVAVADLETLRRIYAEIMNRALA